MSSPHSIDALEAVNLLVAEISGTNNMPAEISRLTRAIDMLTCSIHFIDLDVPGVQETELKAPKDDYQQMREAIKRRYPDLGRYWLAFSSVMKASDEGKLTVSDAIDDLADILRDLRQVQWFKENVNRREALAALLVKYEIHLWLHVHPLRQYLEEMKHDG